MAFGINPRYQVHTWPFTIDSDKKKCEPGTKHDKGKDRWDLLPWEQVGAVVKVLTFGAKKYDDNNWMSVKGKHRYIAAGMRHFTARIMGEINDPETGLPHLAHAICCLLFLMWHDKYTKGD